MGAVELGPLIAGALGGGAWSDRFDRRKVLLAGQVVVSIAGALLLAASLAGDPHVAIVFALAAVLAGATAIVQVARAAVVPALAGPEYLRSAIAVDFGVAQLSSVIGPAFAGPLIAVGGVEAVYGLVAGGFAAMLAVTLPLPPLKPTARDEPQTNGPLDHPRGCCGSSGATGRSWARS